MIDASRFNTNYPWGAIFKLFFICATVAGLLWPSALISAQHTALDFEDSPVSYSQPETENALNRLQAAINSGKTELLYDDDSGYLPEVLKRLDISSSSQMLTFLKSSLQRPLIGPKNPRAIYFNDDTYVGYVPGGFIELIVPDVKKGMVFYSLQQNRKKPEFTREVSRCMTCHCSSRTQNIPGLQIRSMLTDPTGQPVLSAGSYRTGHSSPLEQRWGGWYVTGQHGDSIHRGNFQLPNKKRPKKTIDNSAGQNITDLSQLNSSQGLELSKYETPHSDIVALMVFEHQIDSHNLMARTNYAFQIDSHQDQHSDNDAAWKKEANDLANHLTFTDELNLTSSIQGTSSFRKDFESQGPFDAHKRSLRQFDLKSRLFSYPCSYMVYSKTFHDLPKPVRNFVLSRIKEKLGDLAKEGGNIKNATATQHSEHRYSKEEVSVAQAIIGNLF